MVSQGGGGGGSYVSKAQQASADRYAGQAKAAAEAAARARAIAAGQGNPGALAGAPTAASDPYQEQSYGGGGGGGDYAPMAAAAPVVQKPDLNGYLANSFLVKAAQDEATRGLADYDAETTRGTASVKADQGLRFGLLQKQLDSAGVDNAETMASRGLLRSGLTFQNQDKINAEGATQRTTIGNLLTNFLSDRTGGRVQAEAKARQAQSDARQKEIDNYISLYGGV